MPDDTHHVNPPDYSAFAGLADLRIFLPHSKNKAPKYLKADGLVTGDKWQLQERMTYDEAAGVLANTHPSVGLTGLGIVITSTTVIDDYRLIAIDVDLIEGYCKAEEGTEAITFDPVADADKIRALVPLVGKLATYWEAGPSLTGLHCLALVPKAWAARFANTGTFYPGGCDHAEFYSGEHPTYITLTGKALGKMAPIARIEEADLAFLEKHLKKVETALNTVLPEIELTDGTPLVYSRMNLSDKQRRMVSTGLPQGECNPVVHGLIIRWMNEGERPADILATLLEPGSALLAYCERHWPGKAEAFARRELRQAYGKSIKGMQEALTSFNQKDAAATEQPKPLIDPALVFPVELFDEAPGLVGEIARWIMQASYAPRKEFAYACALSVMACLIGPYCKFGSRGSKVNLYIVLVGGTGTGKNEAFDAACRLLANTDGKDCILDFPSSEAALRRQLNVLSNVLIRADELAKKFASFSKGGADNSALGKAILEAYNGARMPPKVYADKKSNLPAVDNPFVQILGGTTDRLWDVFQTDHLEDGTLNRFIFVCLPDNAGFSCNRRPSYRIEKGLKDKLNAFWRQGRFNDLIGDVDGFGRQITYATEVQQALDALPSEIFKAQQKEYGELYSRFILHVEKIASILAVGDGRNEVGMTDYQQALKFMQWSMAGTFAKVSRRVVGSTTERALNKVVELVEKAGGRMRISELYNSMHKLRREADELVLTLEMAGRVAQEKIKNKNDTETVWVYLVKQGDD